MADLQAIRRALLIEAESREADYEDRPEDFDPDHLEWLEGRASYLRALADEIEDDDSEIEALADEFAENGMTDAADYLREHGRAATLKWLSAEIADEDDMEGWRRGNLEVARDRLGGTG